MGDFGDKVKAADPTLYGERDPADIEQKVAALLSDDTRRPEAVQEIKRLFPHVSHLDDNTITTHALQEIGSPKPAGDPMEIQHALQMKAAAPLYKSNVRDAYTTQEDPTAGDALKERAARGMSSTPTPEEADQPRVPQMSFEEAQAAIKNPALAGQHPMQHLKMVNAANTGDWWNPGKYFPSVQLQDEGGVARGQVSGSYDPSKVEGMPAVSMDDVTGATDVLRQGATQVARAVYDPKAKDGERWLQGWHQPEGGGGPVKQLRQGYGVADYLGDAGANAAEVAPGAARTLGKAGLLMSAGAAAPMGMIDKAEAWALRNLTSGMGSQQDQLLAMANQKPAGWAESWAKENDAESKKYLDAAKDMAMSGAPDALSKPGSPTGLPDNAEVNALAGRAVGKTTGEVAELGGPTAASKAIPVVAKLAAPVVGGALRGGAEVLHDAAPSVIPTSWTLRPSEKAGVQAAGAAGRTAGDLFERKQIEEAMGAMKQAAPTASDEEIQGALMAAKDAWHSPEARTAAVAADPLVNDAFNILQPKHKELFKATYGDNLPYDPFHVNYGQNIGRSNRVFESRTAQEASADMAKQASEDMKMVGEKMRPDQVRGVPGITDDMVKEMTSDPAYEKAGGDIWQQMHEIRNELLSMKEQVPMEIEEIRNAQPETIKAIRDQARQEALAEKMKGMAALDSPAEVANAAEWRARNKSLRVGAQEAAARQVDQGRRLVGMVKEQDASEVGAKRSAYREFVAQRKDAYLDYAQQMAELRKAGPQYLTQPRNSRSLADTADMWRATTDAAPNNANPMSKALSWWKNTGAPENRQVANLKSQNAAQMLAGSARKVAEDNGLARGAWTQQFVEDVPALRKASGDTSFKPVTEYAQQHGVSVGGVPLKNVYRVDQAERSLAPEMEKTLRGNGDVVIHVGGGDSTMDALKDISNLRGRQGPVIINLKGATVPAGMDGMVMPRRVAISLLEQENPSAFKKWAGDAASAIDDAIGLSQLNRVITRGNPGFEQRNRLSELWRMGNHDPDSLSPQTRALVQEISQAPIGSGGRYIPELKMTAGEAHEKLLALGGVGKGISHEAKGLAKDAPGAGWLFGPARKPINALVDAATAPGEAAGDLTNHLLQQGMFPKLAKGYSAEDALRMSVMVNEMAKGASAGAAGNMARNLLIDYGDKNGLQTLLKPLFPFIKYQTGAVEGVARLALENPRRFSRVYDLMRLAEGWDTAFHGGKAINSKFKTDADRMMGAPMMGDDQGNITSYRPETIGSEAATSVEGLRQALGLGSQRDGNNTTLWSLMGPLSGLAENFTGTSANTGRNLYGVDPETFKQLKTENSGDSGWLASVSPRANMARLLYNKEQTNRAAGMPSPAYLGENPSLGLAVQLLQATPGVSRALGVAPVALAGRMAVGGSNPASRSDERTSQMLQRALRSYTTGLRSQTVDPVAQMAQDQRAWAASPKPPMKTLRKESRQFRTTP